MASYLGVDWADGCWVVVKTGDETLITTEPSFLNVWHEHGRTDDVASILVDIPIGLPDSGSRSCDEEAADSLGARRSSVYSIPGRDVVETDDYDTAQKRNGGSLGSQTWWLFPRIREVDIFLQEYDDATEKIYESHPEICYNEFAGESLPRKNTEDGRRRRLEVLEEDSALHEEVSERVDKCERNAMWHHRISKNRLDDVLDAGVLALTAGLLKLESGAEKTDYPAYPRGSKCTPDGELGISPEIVYPDTT